MNAQASVELQEFYRWAKLTAIGDSDYHGLGPLGWCRTFVFARADSQDAILDALRTGHTVVSDRDGRTFGNPELIRLAVQDPQFNRMRSPVPGPSVLIKTSSAGAILGLLGLFFVGFRVREMRLERVE
jgi:hypothetical protein